MGSKISTIVLEFILIISCLTSFLISADESYSNSNISDLNESLSYKFFFNEPSFYGKTLYNTRYAALDMSGCMAIGKRAGEPALPVKFIKLLLPPGTTVKNIFMFGVPVEIHTVDINLVENPVVPYQNPIPIGEKPPEQLVFDNDIYNSLGPYPSEIYGEQSIENCRGYTILSLAIYPVQYVPGNGKVFYYPEITVNIDLDENHPMNQFFRNNESDEKWVEALVSNPDITDRYVTLNLPILEYAGGLCDPSDEYDYVIITTTQNGLDDWETNETIPYNWTSLMEKHTTDDDLNCTLVTIEEIDACSDYWNDTSLFNDTAAHIREFCKDAYQDWGTSYIFIGGDDEWIPAREMDYSYESNVDSDIYWSNLDNTFNDDADNDWGEEGDTGFDLYAELYIGRITCDTPQDVSNWMNKSFYYADAVFTDYLENAAFYGGHSGWECEGDDFIDYSALKGTDDWLGPNPGSHGSYPSWLGFQYGFETWNAKNPGVEFNLSVKWSAAPTPNPGWQGGGDSAAIAGLKDAINNDQVTLISALAHANEYYSMDVSYMSWETDYTNTKPFFLHDYGCHCGDMDAADDGVLHSMLFHSDTELAFACVYNTCYGWGSYDDTNASSSLQQKLFWDYLFDTMNNSGNTMNWQLGKAMAFSKDAMAPTINWTYDGAPGSWRAIIEGCLLFGDPAQKLKPPAILDHNVGIQNIEIDATNPIKPNEKIYINSTVYNNGGNNESNVSVSLLINGTPLDFNNISLFERQTTQQISFNWTSSAGLYLITINITIPEITEDTYTDNEKDHAVVIGVKNMDTGELFDTIQEAIDDSDTLDGHSIFVPCGTYHETITINKNISLQGSDKTTTILQCNESADTVISINDGSYVNITKFTIQNGDYGVNITSSSHVTISSTDIFNHTLAGICLNSSENNTITDNVIYNNTVGINLTNVSNNNTMITNEIVDNNKGLAIESESNYNSIYHNNFNNSQNAIDDGNHNEWDNGCQSGYRLRGGNWWSDYSGTDGNSDGIGDTPYNISGINNSQDHYPLVDSWTGALNGTAYVDDDNTGGPWYGTAEHPYQYIQDAIDNAFDEDIIFVYNGTYHENIIIDKSLYLIGEDKNSTIIDADGSGTVICISADQVSLTGFTIQNSGYFSFSSIDWKNMSVPLSHNQLDDYSAGIRISSSQNTIYENIITNTSFGILELEALSNNNISYNIVKNNYYYGIVIGYSSDITIVENILTNNTLAGINLGYLSNTTIIENTISNNTEIGMELFALVDTTMSDNIIISNLVGLYLPYSSENDIFLNNISNNYYGICLDDTYNNNIFRNNITNNTCGIFSLSYGSDSIYHNNFIHNALSAVDFYNNTWYNSTISSGNYWDDFDEPFEGAYDNNSDGIIDQPYYIDGGDGRDLYPLTGPIGERPDQPVYLQPSDGATGVSTSPTLQVRVTDPNGDTMDVSFYTSGGTLIGTDTNVASGDTASVTWFGRSYSTQYSWYAIANDSTYLTKSLTWSFTTESVPSPPGPGQGGPGGFGGEDTTGPNPPTNVRCTTLETDNTPSFSWNASTDTSGISGYYVKMGSDKDTWVGNVLIWTSTSAIADGTHTFYVKAKDASTKENNGSYGSCSFTINTTSAGNKPLADVGGPYLGLTYQNITFDGSKSYDTDGNIASYTWNLGDGTIEYGKKVIHRYNKSGIYSITLTVVDDDGLADTNTTTVNIILDSDGDGWSDADEEKYNTNKNDPNDYPTDADEDGTPDDYDEDDDNDGLADHLEKTLGSNSTDKSDVIIVMLEGDNNIYYLIDSNKDGKSDKLYSSIGRITTVSMTDDGKYLLDIDGDSKWDYTYDPASKELTPYEEKPSKEFPWLLAIIGIIIAILVIIAILYFTGYIHAEKEYIEEPEPKVEQLEEKPEEHQFDEQSKGQPSEEQQPGEQQPKEQTSEEQQSFDNFKN